MNVECVWIALLVFSLFNIMFAIPHQYAFVSTHVLPFASFSIFIGQVPVPNGKAASQEQPVSLQKADSSSNDLLAQPVPCGVACFSVWGRLWDRVFKTETGQRSKSQ